MKNLKIVFVLVAMSIFNIGMSQQSKMDPNQNPPSPPSFADLLAKMDSNKDGLLAKSEVKGPLKDRFEVLDLNTDGFITEEELSKAKKPNKQGQLPPKK